MTTKTATKPKTTAKAGAAPGPVLLQVKTDDIVPNPANPRKDFGDLTELSSSIAAQGVQQPLVVTPADKDGRHMIIMGHRRYAAAVKAGWDTLPCIVRGADRKTQAELMLVENIQRSGLTAMEEAKGYAHLLDLGESEDQMAKATGRSRATVRRRLKVATLDAEKLGDRQVSFDQLDRIAGFDARPDLQKALCKAAGTNNWNSQLKKCEQAVKEERWLGQTRTTVQDMGLDIIDDQESIYETPDGYRRLGALRDGDLAAMLAGMDTAARAMLTTVSIVTKGREWNNGILLLHRYTPEELAERERRAGALGEMNRQAQQERDAAEQAEHERNARLLDFGRRAERLVLDHIEHITKRATPLPDSAKILAKAVMFVTDNKGDLGKVDAGPAYDDTWGEGMNLFCPDDGHRQQAALYMLLMAGMDGMTPADWGDPDRGLDRLKGYYDILAMTGYRASDEEQQALDGSLLPPEDEEDGE